jgi:hypothetical protein
LGAADLTPSANRAATPIPPGLRQAYAGGFPVRPFLPFNKQDYLPISSIERQNGAGVKTGAGVYTRGRLMMIRSAVASVMLVIAVIALGGVPPARALSMKECSAKYQAAQQAGTLNGMKWADFRKTQCGAAGPQAAATPSAASQSPQTVASNKSKPPMPAGNAVFPAAVSTKYSGETAGKARMHTCLDQYHANKTANANGGLRWIQKGGGYYSECSKRLKG